VALAPGHPEREVWPFEDPLETDAEWAKYNAHYWERDYLGFLEFFFAKCFNEPHSSKQIEDCVGWGLETTPQTLADTLRGIRMTREETFRETCARVRCPTLVLHGDIDLIRPHAQGEALAGETGGELVTLHGDAVVLSSEVVTSTRPGRNRTCPQFANTYVTLDSGEIRMGIFLARDGSLLVEFLPGTR